MCAVFIVLVLGKCGEPVQGERKLKAVDKDCPDAVEFSFGVVRDVQGYGDDAAGAGWAGVRGVGVLAR